MAPAGPGGGWDTTAREMQNALQTEGIVPNVEVFNVEGAGGTIGLAELVNQHAGDDHMLMMMGLVMIGGIELNESPVNLTQVTPIARLTTEYEVVVVPADSPYQTIGDLMDAFKADPGAVSWAGGSAGGTDHFMVGLMAQAVGIDPTQINYVPFSGGGEALSAILGGQTTAGVSGLGEWQRRSTSRGSARWHLSRRSDSERATPLPAPAYPAAFRRRHPHAEGVGHRRRAGELALLRRHHRTYDDVRRPADPVARAAVSVATSGRGHTPPRHYLLERLLPRWR